MAMFFRHLASKLEEDCPNFRDRYVIVQDNAPYKKSEAMMQVYRELQLPMLFSGPHSYAAAPVEVRTRLLLRHWIIN